VIDSFLLLPGSYSGESVDLKIKIQGKPFPASKSVCKAFNLPYGRTVGVHIAVLTPKINKFTNYLFIKHDKIDKINIQEDSEYLIEANLKFSEEVVNRYAASFIGEWYPDYGDDNPEGEYIEPDGTTLLVFSDMISSEG
jgi:hypothetical protein